MLSLLLWLLYLHYFCEPANAWEEGDEIVLYSCRMADVILEMGIDGVKPGKYPKTQL